MVEHVAGRGNMTELIPNVVWNETKNFIKWRNVWKECSVWKLILNLKGCIYGLDSCGWR